MFSLCRNYRSDDHTPRCLLSLAYFTVPGPVILGSLSATKSPLVSVSSDPTCLTWGRTFSVAQSAAEALADDSSLYSYINQLQERGERRIDVTSTESSVRSTGRMNTAAIRSCMRITGRFLAEVQTGTIIHHHLQRLALLESPSNGRRIAMTQHAAFAYHGKKLRQKA